MKVFQHMFRDIFIVTGSDGCTQEVVDNRTIQGVVGVGFEDLARELKKSLDEPGPHLIEMRIE